MGAGVAASPHCPFAGDTRPGRRGSPRWAVSRFEPEPGARAPILRSPSSACAPLGFPAGSPSGPKPWRFAAWQFRNRGPGSCHPAKPPPKHRFRVPAGLPLAEASGLPGSPWTCVLGLPVRSSRAETRSCPTGWGRSPVSAGGSARTCVPPSAGQEPGPKPVVLPFWFGTRRSRNLGTSRSLPLSHPLKGKPAASAWRRLRQPPGLRSAASLSGGTRDPLRSGCGWEGFRPLPVNRLGHVRKLS